MQKLVKISLIMDGQGNWAAVGRCGLERGAAAKMASQILEDCYATMENVVHRGERSENVQQYTLEAYIEVPPLAKVIQVQSGVKPVVDEMSAVKG